MVRILVLLSALVMLGGVGSGCSPRITYAKAIEEVSVRDPNWRGFLVGCERDFADSKWRPSVVEAAHRAGASGARVLLFEYTNAGFPEYRYVLITGDRARIGNRWGETSRRELRGTSVAALLVSEDWVEVLRGAVSEGVWDGDCYFVTAMEGPREKRIAVYDEAQGKTQELILALTELVLQGGR